MKRILFCFSTVFALVLLNSCYYDNFTELHPGNNLSGACDSTKATVSYSNDIVPILNNSCGTNNSCHGTSNNSFVDLTNYAGVSNSAQQYLLYNSVAWIGTASKMPKGSQTKISDCNIALIRKWIDAGAPNN